MTIVRKLSALLLRNNALTEQDIDAVVQRVKQYYDDNQHRLPLGRRFHYNSRMYLHTGDDLYRKNLDLLRDQWAKDTAWYSRQCQAIPSLPYTEPKLDMEKRYRKDSYKKHYKITHYNRVFFKALFQEKIYQDKVNLKDYLVVKDVKQVRDNLIQDREALLILSTAAVNYIYGCNYFLESDPLNPEIILLAGETPVELAYMDYLHAKIYFYTHAIIGASRFYTEEIQSYKEKYVEILHRLENIVTENFKLVSLDQKFEVLVCAKLLGIESSIREAVAQEAVKSLSRKGDFFVDRFNKCRNRKNTFAKSEHRNVLGIMAFI